jgi:hypothetical protein
MEVQIMSKFELTFIEAVTLNKPKVITEAQKALAKKKDALILNLTDKNFIAIERAIKDKNLFKINIADKVNWELITDGISLNVAFDTIKKYFDIKKINTAIISIAKFKSKPAIIKDRLKVLEARLKVVEKILKSVKDYKFKDEYEHLAKCIRDAIEDLKLELK